MPAGYAWFSEPLNINYSTAQANLSQAVKLQVRLPKKAQKLLASITARSVSPQEPEGNILALVALPKRTLGADERPLNHHLNPPKSL